jgi:hypothetical protein
MPRCQTSPCLARAPSWASTCPRAARSSSCAAGTRWTSSSSPATPTSTTLRSPRRSWAAFSRPRAFAWRSCPSPTGARPTRGVSSAGRGSSTRSAPATWIRWSTTTRPIERSAIRTPTRPVARSACAPIARPGLMRSAAARPSRTSRSWPGASRHRCAASRTTTTGRTRCAPRAWFRARPISSPSAWASARSSPSPRGCETARASKSCARCAASPTCSERTRSFLPTAGRTPPATTAPSSCRASRRCKRILSPSRA